MKTTITKSKKGRKKMAEHLKKTNITVYIPNYIVDNIGGKEEVSEKVISFIQTLYEKSI